MRCSVCASLCARRRWCYVCVQARKLCDIPYFRVLLLLFAFILCSTPIISFTLPQSKLYKMYNNQDDVMKIAKDLNANRLTKALQYLKGLDNRTSQNFYKANALSAPDVVVSVVTVSRDVTKNTSYLLQTVSVIDQIIKSDVYFNKILLQVCNVDRRPVTHKEAVLLQSYVPYIQKHGANSWNQTFHIPSIELHNEDLNRGYELADYVYCLNVSRLWGSPYILMLEDDVVPYENIFKVLHYTLTQRHFLHSSHDELNISSKQQFSFLKLYYPEKWQGYANEVDRILELVSLAILGGGILYAILTMSALMLKTIVSYKTGLFYFMLGCAMTVFVVVLVGRQNVMDARRLSPQLFKLSPTPACCTPAMFYSSHIIPGLIDHLMKHTDKNKDLAIYDYIDENHIPGYILEPNLVRHIGMFTSLQNAYKSPYEFNF